MDNLEEKQKKISSIDTKEIKKYEFVHWKNIPYKLLMYVIINNIFCYSRRAIFF
jgi:hypothetical protein